MTHQPPISGRDERQPTHIGHLAELWIFVFVNTYCNVRLKIVYLIELNELIFDKPDNWNFELLYKFYL